MLQEVKSGVCSFVDLIDIRHCRKAQFSANAYSALQSLSPLLRRSQPYQLDNILRDSSQSSSKVFLTLASAKNFFNKILDINDSSKGKIL